MINHSADLFPVYPHQYLAECACVCVCDVHSKVPCNLILFGKFSGYLQYFIAIKKSTNDEFYIDLVFMEHLSLHINKII